MATARDECVCAVCERLESGLGYHPANRLNNETLWLCDDPECRIIAEGVFRMKQDHYSLIEKLAAERGGDAGGQFLDTIGKTDLAALSEPEYREFCRRVIGGYRSSLKDLCAVGGER